eukprot:scaffold48751_cov50-Phaeocystis_antarctica.AAC.1
MREASWRTALVPSSSISTSPCSRYRGDSKYSRSKCSRSKCSRSECGRGECWPPPPRARGDNWGTRLLELGQPTHYGRGNAPARARPAARAPPPQPRAPRAAARCRGRRSPRCSCL